MIYVITANDTFQTWLTSTQQAIVVVNQFLQGGNINVNFANANSINVIGSGISLNVSNSVYIGGNVTVNQNVTVLGALVTGSQTVTGDETNSGNITVNGVISTFAGNVKVAGNITVTSSITAAGINLTPTIIAAFNQANTANVNAALAFGYANSVGSNLTLAWGRANNSFGNILISTANVGFTWTPASNTSYFANATSNSVKIVCGTGLLFYSDTVNNAILITDIGTSSTANTLNNMINFFVPTGGVIDYFGSSEPTGWLFCSGNAISRTTYANLFAIIGTTCGIGDGSTTFNVPDLRGRVTVGRDNMGGNAAFNITIAGSGINANLVANFGGSQFVQTHTHVLYDPGHTHVVNDPTHAHILNSVVDNLGPFAGTVATGVNATNLQISSGPTAYAATGITIAVHTTGVSANTYGSGNANNMMPTYVTNKIIKT